MDFANPVELFKFFQAYGTVAIPIATALWGYHRWSQHRLDTRFAQERRERKRLEGQIEAMQAEYRLRDIQIMTALRKTGVSPKTGKAGATLWTRYGFGPGEVIS